VFSELSFVCFLIFTGVGYYYYYEIVHEVHNKNTQKDNKNADKLELKKVIKH